VTTPLTVALVGPGFHENLALEYLAAATLRSGHRAHTLFYGSCQDAPRVVEQVVRLNADVVGLSIAFQSCLSDSIYLAEQLRAVGFAGHITCGGHVPSFEYTALLGDCPAIDSAVRHDGELTLVELLTRLSHAEPLRGIPGLVWRDTQGLCVEPARRPLQALDELPCPLRGVQPRRLAGIPMSFVIGSRGCVGDCAYCCIRAFARDAHGPAYRLREPAAIAQEIANLTNEQGVTAIFLEDDLFVLPSQTLAVARIRALNQCLTEAGAVKCAYWAKARPDTVTPAVLDAAKQLGIIHFFLGIENHASARLQYLGRNHQPAQNEQALAMLSESGLGASFNLMLFDPDCCLDDVAVNLDFMATHLDLPWNICRTELYSGTELLQRVRAAGRLLGDYRSYGYVMQDTRAELMFRVVRVSFRQRAFDATSLLNHVITLCFGYQLHQALCPGKDSDDLACEIQRLAVEVHTETVDALRRIFEFATHADLEDTQTARRVAVKLGFEINNKDLVWRKRFDQFSRLLDARGRAVCGSAPLLHAMV